MLKLAKRRTNKVAIRCLGLRAEDFDNLLFSPIALL